MANHSAGWYISPTNPQMQHYWNGTEWIPGAIPVAPGSSAVPIPADLPVPRDSAPSARYVQPGTTRHARRTLLRLVIVAALIVGGVAFGVHLSRHPKGYGVSCNDACQATLNNPAPGDTGGGIDNGGSGEDVQTYPVSYADITCDQWLNDMTSQQKLVASHDMIIALKAFDTSDTFAASFVADIDEGCTPAPELKMAEIAAGIATLATADFGD